MALLRRADAEDRCRAQRREWKEWAKYLDFSRGTDPELILGEGRINYG
jgi:hypothetical protein